MKLSEMVGFSLGFMLRKPKSLLFFMPVFLLNIIAGIVTYLVLGGQINPDEYAELVGPALVSEDFVSIFMIPEIQITTGILIVSGVLGWILGSYAEVCMYKAAESEHRKKKWSARNVLGRFVGILPGYLLLSAVTFFIILIPIGSAMGLVVLWQLGFFNSLVFGILLVLLALLLGVIGSILTVYLGVRLFVPLAVVVIEKKGVVESLRRSWSLTKRSFWYVLLNATLFFIIIAIISAVLSIPVMVLGLVEANQSPIPPLSSLLGYLIGFYTSSAWTAFIYTIYLSLTERKKKTTSR